MKVSSIYQLKKIYVKTLLTTYCDWEKKLYDIFKQTIKSNMFKF